MASKTFNCKTIFSVLTYGNSRFICLLFLLYITVASMLLISSWRCSSSRLGAKNTCVSPGVCANFKFYVLRYIFIVSVCRTIVVIHGKSEKNFYQNRRKCGAPTSNSTDRLQIVQTTCHIRRANMDLWVALHTSSCYKIGIDTPLRIEKYIMQTTPVIKLRNECIFTRAFRTQHVYYTITVIERQFETGASLGKPI